MTDSEAYDLLLAHAGMRPEHPRFTEGFLGMLRPYKGLIESNFHEIMTAIRTLAPTLENNAMLDHNLMGALWGICHFGRAWALEPEGMLQRNQLISQPDSERLAEWLNMISYAVSSLLDGSGEEEAFSGYESA